MGFAFRRRASIALVVLAAATASGHLLPSAALAQATATATLPAQLTDREFWTLVEDVSEPDGQFQSDNFLSNERGYQVVIPELVATARAGRVYLGVGPEQNFPYILALKPSLAIIFDVRRGNLHLHLLYKALFELSADRAEFLSKLFSRPRPDGLTPESSVQTLMDAYATVAGSETLYAENLAAVISQLTSTHRFALQPGDREGIDYVYRTAFFSGGPSLTYSMAGRGSRGFGGRGRNDSTYAEIQALTDGRGVNRGFLATERQWRAMKEFQARNLLVPVVGDFSGTRAIRAVGAFLKARGAMVSAFYLSNVEQYLNRNGMEDVFLCNAAALPLDDTSTFIYTGAGRFGQGGGFGGGGRGGGLNTTFLRPILPDVAHCAGATQKAAAP